jgi:hypothetical protein
MNSEDIMKKSFIGAMLLILWFKASAVTVDPAKAVIVVDKNADGVVQFAALELQKYLHWITGTKIAVANQPVAGKYPLIFGTPAGVRLKPEEARWEVTKDHTRLYGDSTLTGTSRILKWKILTTPTKSGDLTAVYDFLEKQLGVLFLAPGKDGVSFEPVRVLELKEGKGTWVPKLAYRFMWPDRAFWGAPRLYNQDGSIKDAKQGGSSAPAEFQPPTKNEYLQKESETRLWLKQQRMGQSGEKLNSGHAFTNWWERFGKNHPEYFAMVNGKRQPPSRPRWVKLCVSNPAVWKQIVKDWAATKKRGHFVNVCENDGYGFCECEACRKLDMPPRPGAKWDDDLSDRYVYFANQVLNEARKIDPEARVCQYGYSLYRFPPRREKLTDANYIIYVPSMLDNLEENYQAWQKAGARHFLLRPNDLHMNTPLPMGFDKQIFEAFRIGMKYGVMGTSYDSLHGFWDISGLADYVIARGHVDPSKDYDHWVNEYCSAYGAAAPEVRAYFDYFRTNIWEKRLLPHRKAISEAGNNGNFRLGLMRLIATYYKESDFDAVEKILRKGMEKKLSPRQKYRLETLLLVNEHSRLTFRAIAAKDLAKVRAAVDLIHFRRKYKNRLNINWERLFNIEAKFGDCTGTRAAEVLGRYDDFRKTPQWWVFCTDPEQVGEKEKWHELPYRELWKKNRQMLRIDAPWEKQRYLKDEKFRKMLESYDGIGYYCQTLPIPAEWKGKEIFLIFGAVDESAWVYVNGKFAGKHIFAAANDWQTPFAIPITDTIDWQKDKQTVVVRVEDKNGLGGIWKPVMLAVREKGK